MEVSFQYLEEEAKNLVEYEANIAASHLISLIKNYERERKECLNLNAEQSLTSPIANEIMNLAIRLDSSSQTVSKIGSTHLGGQIHFDKIFLTTRELAKKLFKASFVECRLPSASLANCIAIRCLTDIGDSIMALPNKLAPQKCHGTYREPGYAGYRGLRITDVPLDEEGIDIDLEAMSEAATRVKPKVIILGSSYMLFPYPLNEIMEVADDVEARVMYDGAHVLGLIAGGKFQDPLREGADLLLGSTQKTFSGPLGGIIVTNDEELGKKVSAWTPNHISAIAGAKVAANAITLIEWLEYGKEYAEQMVKNAKALAEALDKAGFMIIGKGRGYTESHIVLLKLREAYEGIKGVELLERAKVWCFADTFTEDGRGIRLGTTEITRLGMKEKDMKLIADFIKRTLLGKEDPKKVAKDVTEFRKGFKVLQYCFNK